MSRPGFTSRASFRTAGVALLVTAFVGLASGSLWGQGFSISVPFFEMHSDPVHGTHWSAPFASGHGPPVPHYPHVGRYDDDWYEDQREAWEDYQEDLEDYYEDARRRPRRSFYRSPAYLPFQPPGVVRRPQFGVVAPGPAAPVPGNRVVASEPVAPARALNGAAARLHRELSRISTGEGWKRFLNLGLLLRASAGQGGSLGDQAESQAELAAALERFEDVAANPEYQMVAQLNGFAATRQALSSYLAEGSRITPDPIGASDVEMPNPPADGEEIPTPEPADPPAADVGRGDFGRQVSGPLFSQP